ncbi:MAG TPA: redoxin family protein [Rudaea sp.]|jgi:thiol-disulfide isomerase/thioredoxin|nr:redoxin family protein [Rudaea sp.]
MNSRVRAPAWPASLEWINTDQPPTLDALRGRVVLMHFWTFDCVNCINSLPDLRYLENKYHDGLSVVGVHAPKYDYQRQGAAVLKAVNRGHVRHAVVNDCNFELWQAYGVQAWPTMAVIDAEGQLAALLPGEGRRQETDAMIGQLLDEAASKDQRVYETPGAVGRPEARMPLLFPRKVLATDSSLWISDSGHNRVLECNHEGRILRQFGSGNPGYWDGANKDAGFTDPQGLAIVKDWLYVADTGNHALRRIRLLSGEVETAAGTGTIGYELPNDDVEPSRVAMSAPTAVAGTGEKVYFVLAGQNQVWQLDLIKNRLSVLAGNGQLGLTDGDSLTASFAQPSGISLIGQQLVICDSASSSLRVLRLLDNNVSTLAGAGLYEFGDVPGKRDTARLQHPLDVCADPRGLIFVADSYNGKIKALNMRTGEVRPLNLPYKLSEPNDLSLANNALWIANTNAHEIVRVDLKSGQIRRLTIGE